MSDLVGQLDLQIIGRTRGGLMNCINNLLDGIAKRMGLNFIIKVNLHKTQKKTNGKGNQYNSTGLLESNAPAKRNALTGELHQHSPDVIAELLMNFLAVKNFYLVSRSGQLH